MISCHTNQQSLALHRKDGRILDVFSSISPSRVPSSISHVCEIPGMRTTRLRVEREDAIGNCEFVSLEDGLYLVVLDLALPTGLRTRLVGEDLIEFHYRLSGSIYLNGTWGTVHLEQPSFLLWHQPMAHNDVWEELGGEKADRELSVTLFVEAKWLRQMQGGCVLGTSDEFGKILRGGEKHPTYQVTKQAAQVSDILSSIIQDKDEGALRLFNMKARGYELLASSLKALTNTSTGDMPFFTLKEIEQIEKAKNILECEFDNPPLMAEVARRVGLNLNKMTLGLRSLHGTTGQKIIKSQRLLKAYDLLKHSDLQVGQIANAVGYSHQSTFTAAFMERFLISPKDLMMARKGSKRQPTYRSIT